jgi:hypothetical protein
MSDATTEQSEVTRYEELRQQANRALWTIDRQIRRLREPVGDDLFVLGPISDAEWLIIQLDRFLCLARRVNELSAGALEKAINAFLVAIPELRNARNVIAHLDEYVVGGGRNPNVRPSQLSTHVIGDDEMTYGGFALGLAAALAASHELFAAIREHPPQSYRRAVQAAKDRQA